MNSFEAIRTILEKNNVSSQEELRTHLRAEGLELNQSTISRALKRLGVTRVVEKGRKIYRMPDWDAPPSVEASLGDLLLSAEANDSMVVVQTKPGSASLLARHIDHYLRNFVLGTLAGDDTIFVAPRKSISLSRVVSEIYSALGITNH